MTRIDGLNTGAAGRAMQGAALGAADPSQSQGAKGTENANGRQDNVVVSNRARLMSVASRAVQGSSDVRAAKVAALKAAIANGSYSIDHQGIAERLLQGGSFE
jgi:negative regulator of flagellin synthesis FlgM